MSFGRRRCTLDLSRYSSSESFLPFDLVGMSFFIPSSLALSMESMPCPTFGWDLERTPTTSICCKDSNLMISAIFAEILYRKQYLLTVSLRSGLPGAILTHTRLE